MLKWSWLLPCILGLCLVLRDPQPATACCPAYPPGKPVLNSDQTILILWDPATKMEHFIRQATFAGRADDFAFMVPSPTLPDLSESGDGVFPALTKITAPEEITVEVAAQSEGWCYQSQSATALPSAGAAGPNPLPEVRVLGEKTVAGFKAVVLEADTTEVLVKWLGDHGYQFSPAVADWAAPYVEGHWKITALKIDKQDKQAVRSAAPALRISFRTDRPLFPYREPDATEAVQALNLHSRLLRIFFIGEARYAGEVTPTQPWTGQAAWSQPLTATDRDRVLSLLKLPADTGPSTFWLTEFEDPWPYRKAEADLYFHPASNQVKMARPPIYHYVYVKTTPWAEWVVLTLAVGLVAFGLTLYLRSRRPRTAA